MEESIKYDYKKLNSVVPEPETITFYPKSLFHFTFNQVGSFCHTQLGVIMDLPSQETLDRFDPIEIYVAPTGTRYLDFPITDKDDLMSRGWTAAKIGPAPSYEKSISGTGMKGRRTQYGIKHHIVSTIHAAIGLTIGKLATQISSKMKGSNIWERGQLVVLLSRTQRLSDMIFVGNKNETLSCLREALKFRSQFDEYMEQILDVLSGVPEIPRVIDQSVHPFSPKNVALPPTGNGVVYLIVSCKDNRSTYIGQTNDMLRRLKEHNSGRGSKQTSPDHLRPWGLLAYVVGFEQNTRYMMMFEKKWEQQRQRRMTQNQLDYSPSKVITWGKETMDVYNRRSNNVFRSETLHMVIAGQFDR